MSSKVSNIVKYVISALLAVVLLYFSFRGVKWSDFAAGLSNCRWGFVVASMAMSVLVFWIRGLRWRLLLLPIDQSTRRLTTFDAINIGYLANFVIPRIGEFVRCGVITKDSAPDPSVQPEGSRKLASYDKVLGTVVLERSWDLLSMIILLVMLLVFRWQKFGQFFTEKIFKPAAGGHNFNLWWIVLICCLLFGVFLWAVIHFRDRNRFCAKVCGFFKGLGQGIVSCLHMKKAWLFFVYTIFIWGLYWLMSAATMYALPQISDLGMADALFLMMVGSLGWLVPVPGGFGAFHYIVALALSTVYGLPFSMGIIFATLAHESQSVTMVIFGGLGYAVEALRK